VPEVCLRNELENARACDNILEISKVKVIIIILNKVLQGFVIIIYYIKQVLI
jgi:hypothetical protein